VNAAIQEVSIARVGVSQIDVGQLSVGPLSVGSLVLETTHVDVSTGSAQFRNLRVTISLRMTIDWEVSITIPLAGTFGFDGTIDLGTPSITVPLGDVSLPGLQSLSLDLPSLTVENLAAAVGPIRDLRLGALVAENIRARGVVAPVPDFQLLGLGLGRVAVEGLSVPAASAADATVGSIRGGSVPLGTVTIPNLALPQAALGDLTSQAVDVGATSNPIAFVADAGVLKLTLTLTPAARIRTDELRISGVRSSATIREVRLTDVVLPFEVLNLTLSQIGIDTIQVPEIEVR
jgi:hypothetical protein